MELHKIEKQKLLSEPYSEDALKLARGLYYTFLEEEEPLEMHIKLDTIFKLLRINDSLTSIKYIESLLNELNEPLAVKNFMYMGKSYNLRFITFATYQFQESELLISLSEEFLHAHQHYMLDTFLNP